ncbi:MAG: hypothetical protein GC182_21515 [Rhodopseudomonas sp.]|nr:hypothetical protein [Rhodopseudomonas sp.]
MGEVIQFPEDAVGSRGGRWRETGSESGIVIILPVIRIDRAPGGSNGFEPDTGNHSGRRRRRPIAR